MSGMFPVASFPCICNRIEDYHCVSVSCLFGSPLSRSIFVYEWPHLSVALTASMGGSPEIVNVAQLEVVGVFLCWHFLGGSLE